jgi:small nuclear ribonucleoprotein (snRNP)-like protein
MQFAAFTAALGLITKASGKDKPPVEITLNNGIVLTGSVEAPSRVANLFLISDSSERPGYFFEAEGVLTVRAA